MCRIIEKLSKCNIRDEINYKTQSLSSLQEKNVALFLKSVEQSLGLKDLFGKEKEKTLRQYESFVPVLQGLAKLSKHQKVVQASGKQGFDASNRKAPNACIADGEEPENSDYIGAYAEEKGTDEMYQQYMSVNKPSNLGKAIDELVRINEHFLTNVK